MFDKNTLRLARRELFEAAIRGFRERARQAASPESPDLMECTMLPERRGLRIFARKRPFAAEECIYIYIYINLYMYIYIYNLVLAI